MFSAQRSNELGAGQHDLAIQLSDDQRAPSAAGSAPRRGAASRARRCAIAVALATGVTTASTAILTSAGHSPDATAAAAAMQAPQPQVPGTTASYLHRMHTLEAAGYQEVACSVDGELLFNPVLHRYVTARP